MAKQTIFKGKEALTDLFFDIDSFAPEIKNNLQIRTDLYKRNFKPFHRKLNIKTNNQ